MGGDVSKYLYALILIQYNLNQTKLMHSWFSLWLFPVSWLFSVVIPLSLFFFNVFSPFGNYSLWLFPVTLFNTCKIWNRNSEETFNYIYMWSWKFHSGEWKPLRLCEAARNVDQNQHGGSKGGYPLQTLWTLPSPQAGRNGFLRLRD